MLNHDPDDPPPIEDWDDHCWWFLNRWAEWGMKCTRMFGFL